MTRERMLADGISDRESGIFLTLVPADPPTPQSLARLQSNDDEWCEAAPCDVWLAREADYLGEDAIAAQALERAGRLYAAEDVAPNPLMRDIDRDAGRAYYLALSGAPVDQVVELAEKTLELTAETDPLDLDFNRAFLAKAVAAAGGRAQALAMLESMWPDGRWLGLIVYHDPYLQRWMQDEPGFQNLRERIAATFEPL